MSATEQQALEAGDVWWDVALFSGNPDWSALLTTPPARLSEEEQAFLDGPVESLCRMADDWRISFEVRRVPDEIWDFIRANGFLGMIILRKYGGLGFSAAAHSAVIRKLSTRSVSLAVTVMVPNSPGPGRVAPAVRHRGAEATLSAAARQRARAYLLCPDQSRSGFRCGIDGRPRRGLLWRARTTGAYARVRERRAARRGRPQLPLQPVQATSGTTTTCPALVPGRPASRPPPEPL